MSEAARETLHEICSEFEVQLPDLFVIAPDGISSSFAEVKGKGDQLSDRQIPAFKIIRQRMKIRIEVINVKLVDLPRV